MTCPQANKTWSANDGQCLAFACPHIRLPFDPYCAAHRTLINAGDPLPIPKPPAIPSDWPWNPQTHKPNA